MKVGNEVYVYGRIVAIFKDTNTFAVKSGSQFIEVPESVITPVIKFDNKGEWIPWTDDRKDYVRCSRCDYGEEGEVLFGYETPFCPYCGADMRKGAKE